MNEKEKQEYLERYHQDKEKGLPFFPDIIFKDVVVSLLVFVILVALAYFIGAPLEERANPADTTYTPRPEWYFLFLFQLLKYFPGNLEVLGVVVLPTLAIILLLVLPFLDQSPSRYFLKRPAVIGVTSILVAGVVFLTVQAYQATPPPEATAQGDQTAALYAKNCAGCHGSSISVPPGTNLHAIIAQGRHEGMPAWSADLTTDQIDALAGFIQSPGGSKLFTDNCGECHQVTDLVAGNPLELKNALEQGQNYPPHQSANVPNWEETLNAEQRTTLLNFLVAPDGQRLFTINCSPCHGRAVGFSGDESQLRTIISQGGMHVQMPPWREKLSDTQLDTLAKYVVDPASVPDGQQLFQQYCTDCHGQRVPVAKDVAQARETIAQGGPHQTMPVWGNILTSQQLDALVAYTINAAKGTSTEIGQKLFSTNCSPCHGQFGEGGANPTRPGDIIAPISSAEFLKTRDDVTLRAIISQGQPNFGMSPFGSSYGGPLSDEEIDAVIAYIRTWEENPPVELPPEVSAVTTQIPLNGTDIYKNLCAQCHGPKGEGGIGPSLSDPKFQDKYTDQQIFDTINKGHKATSMIAWGEILSSEQIQQVVEFIRQLREASPTVTPTKIPAETTPEATAETTAEATAETPTETPMATVAETPTFESDVLPIFQEHCKLCHGTLGGWDSSSYESVMTSGNNAPVVIPGDVESSLLAQKLLGTQEEGNKMPPQGTMPDDQIQTILDWIAAGAPEN
ncbi:MAG: c-type cytochrome [Anaerolineales bacterium]|jgi:mono/diheme cytochrome c family protein